MSSNRQLLQEYARAFEDKRGMQLRPDTYRRSLVQGQDNQIVGLKQAQETRLMTNQTITVRSAAVANSGADNDDIIVAYAVGDTNITTSGPQTVDNVMVPDATNVLLTSQTDDTENGVWITSDSGSWTMYDPFTPVGVLITSGDTYANSLWLWNFDETPQAFEQVGGAGGPSVLVAAAATANIPAVTAGGQPLIDTYQTQVGDLVLAHLQTITTNRKVYKVTMTGAWTEASKKSKVIEVLNGAQSGQCRYFKTATNVYTSGKAFYG